MFGRAAFIAWLVLAPPLSASVLLNEIAFDEKPGPDWVELVNAGTTPVSIDGWVLDDADTGAGNAVHLALSTPVPPGCFLTVWIDAAGVDETDFSDGWGAIFSGTATTVNLAATEDEVALFRSAALTPAALVDFVAWVTDPPYGGTGDASTAVAAGLWPADAVVAVSDSGSGYSIGRSRDGGDTNGPADWRTFSRPSPGRSNRPSPSPYSTALTVDPARRAFSPFDSDPRYQTTTLFFDAGSAEAVKTLWVWDVRGRRVRTLIDNDRDAGGADLAGLATGSVVWDGRDEEGVVVPVGVYGVTLEAADPSGDMRRGRDTVAVGRPR